MQAGDQLNQSWMHGVKRNILVVRNTKAKHCSLLGSRKTSHVLVLQNALFFLYAGDALEQLFFIPIGHQGNLMQMTV